MNMYETRKCHHESPHVEMRSAKTPTTTHQSIIIFYSYFNLTCFGLVFQNLLRICLSCLYLYVQFVENLVNMMEHEQETNLFLRFNLYNIFFNIKLIVEILDTSFQIPNEIIFLLIIRLLYFLDQTHLHLSLLLRFSSLAKYILQNLIEVILYIF